MSYYYPFGTGNATSNISFALAATSASFPLNVATLMPTAQFATSVVTAPAAGANGSSKTAVDCASTTGVQGAQGVAGIAGTPGTDQGTGNCPAGTKECPSLNASLAAINATQGPNDQFGVVCLDLLGRMATSLDCPGSLPSGIPTLPAYT